MWARFTNHTFSRDRAFTGVLDYIFVSPHWHVADVMDTPPLNDDTVRAFCLP
jgi:mRNA deadenylase 3'-5' endonuclease subunit Ccr4